MGDQVFEVAVSPAQRFALIQLSHEKGAIVAGQEGRKYRRFIRAFALDYPLSLLRRDLGCRREAVRDEETIELFEVTEENVEYAIKVIDESKLKTPHQEDVLGSLYDALDNCWAKREDYTRPPSGLKAFDAKADRVRWTPVDQPEEVADFLVDVADVASYDEKDLADLGARAKKLHRALFPDQPDPWAEKPPEEAVQ